MQASPWALAGQPPSQITAPNKQGCLPHSLGGARRQHTHRAHNPTCKEAAHPPAGSPGSPGHPHGRSDYTPGAGAATLAKRGPGHTHGRPTTPQGGQGPQVRTCEAADAPCLLSQAGRLRSEDPRSTNVTRGVPPARASPKPSGPRPLEPTAEPLRTSGPRPARRVPQEPMAAAACAGGRRTARVGRRRAAPQPRSLVAAARASRAPRSAAAVRMRAERASGEGGAASAGLRSPRGLKGDRASNLPSPPRPGMGSAKVLLRLASKTASPASIRPPNPAHHRVSGGVGQTGLGLQALFRTSVSSVSLLLTLITSA